VGPVRYLRVIGRLTADNRLVLRPSYLSDRPRHPEPRRQSGLLAELFDDGGRLLLRHPLRVQPMCGDGQPLGSLAVRGWVPFPAATRLIRFSHEGLSLEEVRVSERGPEIRLAWGPPPEPAGRERIAWEAAHPEGRALQFFARYTHTDGQRWLRLGWRTDAREAEVDFDQLPGGDRCRVAVVATDGVNTTTAESGTFRVRVKPCRAMIFAPDEGATAVVGAPVLLRGQGYYLEEARPETEALTWTSSRDGDIGAGTLLAWSPRAPGEHRVTLAAGIGERQGTTAITIHVEPEPGRPADTLHTPSA
jgi:hypothetical protein